MFGRKLKNFILLILVLAAQVAFGQSKGMVIYQSDGNIIRLAVSEIDSINFNACADIDGNIYLTVKIGNQWWMAENLKVTHYRNGEVISIVTDNIAWSNLTTGAYCEYDNNSANVETYGRLYNWYAVNDSRNIAPTGWHVPTDTEWQTLINYLGGDEVAGGKMKEAGTTHWNSLNVGATNESGFTAFPGGCRYYNGDFQDMGYYTGFWSSTENGSAAWGRTLDRLSAYVEHVSDYKQNGFSVRLVRD